MELHPPASRGLTIKGAPPSHAAALPPSHGFSPKFSEAGRSKSLASIVVGLNPQGHAGHHLRAAHNGRSPRPVASPMLPFHIAAIVRKHDYGTHPRATDFELVARDHLAARTTHHAIG